MQTSVIKFMKSKLDDVAFSDSEQIIKNYIEKYQPGRIQFHLNHGKIGYNFHLIRSNKPLLKSDYYPYESNSMIEQILRGEIHPSLLELIIMTDKAHHFFINGCLIIEIHYHFTSFPTHVSFSLIHLTSETVSLSLNMFYDKITSENKSLAEYLKFEAEILVQIYPEPTVTYNSLLYSNHDKFMKVLLSQKYYESAQFIPHLEAPRDPYPMVLGPIKSPTIDSDLEKAIINSKIIMPIDITAKMNTQGNPVKKPNQ